MGKYLVGLDDGHGINTAGKRTVELKEDIKFNGKTRKKGTIIHENEFNEAIMRKVEPILKRCGIDYVELAPTDSDTPLSTRANTANRKGCDLVVSIHANALTGDKWQNKAYGLVVIKTRGCQSKTDKLASIMYKNLKEVDFPSNGETKYGIRVDTEISGFTLAILRQTKMPATLIELGFMDNWEDVKVMCTEKFQDECAEGIAKAICEYLGVDYKKGNPTPSKPNSKPKKFQIKVLCNTLNVRKVADWDAKSITTVKKGQHLDVIDTVDAKNGSTKMYKLESGLYITAHSKYVEKV
ncbi:MAG: N-acetylmuramoyl-L-alanine amidase [Terrisporobacter othiniensis]|nr:N-acetylmuramoyl-L-alanine amidase [Terrisporobacter othiniensis]